MSKIIIFNYKFVENDPDFYGIKKEDLEIALLSAFTLDFDINIIFVSNSEIKRINAEHRGKDSITDVISFDSLDLVGGKKSAAEIYIASDFILRELKSSACTADLINRKLFLVESIRMIIHGILHVNGYDHKEKFTGGFEANAIDNIIDKSKMEVMFIEQEKALKKVLRELKV